MANYTYINGDMQILADVLDDSGYFDSVVYSDPNDETITCYVGQLAMLTIIKTYGTGDDRCYTMRVRGVEPIWTRTSELSGEPHLEVIESYRCSGGLYLRLRQASGYNNSDIESLIITKNQNNDTTIVFHLVGATDAGTVSIGAIAATDRGDFTYMNANDVISNQTSLIAVCSCTGTERLSYTPKVKASIYKQRIDFGYISYNNKVYLYNGYLAVEDTLPRNT